MHITPNILSIPPYISTTWDNITSIRSEADYLFITLKSGPPVAIQGLSASDITTIFEAHASYNQTKLPNFATPLSMSLPLNPGESTSFGELHQNPDQPDIPAPILEKLATVAKAFGLNDIAALSDCNCIYCQIGRLNALEEKISDEDLKFRDWEVKQTGEKLYTVTNPIEQNEQYHIFLGDPIGCTCGQKNCEHMKAVLQS